MSPHQVARQLALIQVLAGLLREARAGSDETAAEALTAGDRITATLNGHKIATVSMTRGATRARVVDEDRLTAWVADRHPDEVETVTRVRPAYLKQLQDQARKAGAPVDPTTGEEIPGLEVTEGQAHPSVRLADGARSAVAAAWRDGTLPPLGELLPQIEGGES